MLRVYHLNHPPPITLGLHPGLAGGNSTSSVSPPKQKKGGSLKNAAAGAFGFPGSIGGTVLGRTGKTQQFLVVEVSISFSTPILWEMIQFDL